MTECFHCGLRVPRGSELAPGDVVRVQRGCAFPTDGTVTEGATTANESLLTGESAPSTGARAARSSRARRNTAAGAPGKNRYRKHSGEH